MYYIIKSCRACGGTDLAQVLDLGLQPLANDFRKPDDEFAGFAPLKVMLCNTCSLAQLSVVVKPEILYSRYSYVTSKSETMAKHFEAIVEDIFKEVPLSGSRKKLLEIGSNDGTFLSRPSVTKCCDVLGIEPADNLAKSANEKGINTRVRFFDTSSAIELHYQGYSADIIVARHVFCHVDYWEGFIHGLEILSNKNTLVFIEVPYVMDMFKMNSYDQVYHEHLSYMTITALQHALEKTCLRLHRIIHYTIHGGAVGIMLKHRDSTTSPDSSVAGYLGNETHSKLVRCWATLASKTEELRETLHEHVSGIYGCTTYCGFGASAKSTVWANYCHFNKRQLAFICDNTPEKQGCLIPGTDIPVLPESALLSEEPDYAIIFAWNFAQEIMAKHKFAGSWIMPLPEVEVV
jgi:2-polyprenyl-3-methyl-5-hydroxy-6-metoxy-1,4-benzoquinol methylase